MHEITFQNPCATSYSLVSYKLRVFYTIVSYMTPFSTFTVTINSANGSESASDRETCALNRFFHDWTGTDKPLIRYSATVHASFAVACALASIGLE